MDYVKNEEDLVGLFGQLVASPLRHKDLRQILVEILHISQRALQSYACVVTLVDEGKSHLNHIACVSRDKGFEELFTGASAGEGDGVRALDSVDFKLLARGGVIKKNNLQQGKQSIISPELARKFNLNSLLSYPLKSDERLVGYVSHYHLSPDQFSDHDERLLGIFADQIMLVLEKANHQSVIDRALTILKELLQSPLSASPDDFLETVAEKACELLSVPICIVWKIDEQDERLKVVATCGGIDEDYKKIELELSEAGFERSSRHRGVAYIEDVTKKNERYSHPAEAKQRGWVSLLSAPVRVHGRLIGMLDVYTKEARFFKHWERDLFGAFAYHAALSIEKSELLKRLTNVMLQMSDVGSVEELLEILLKGSLELVCSNRGWISLLNDKTGELHIVAPKGGIPGKRQLKLGRGITGKALIEERPVRVGNVKSVAWHGVYEKFWEDTCSEMAIPLLLIKAQAHVGQDIKLVTKPIGVLNIESPVPNAFSKLDEDCILSLAYQAAIIIERLEGERKRESLRNIEQKIVNEKDYEQVIQVLMRGIMSTLGFEYVNISLVDQEENSIKTEYIRGLQSKNEIDRFKSMAVHSLNSKDIQADIVRRGKTEVPAQEDERFDDAIYRRFGHDKMLRVFVPMVGASDTKPFGTVEAGYQKRYRKHIYERDVQILQSFVDYAVQAFEQKRSGMLDKISHEFKAPIVGIRNNASFLQRRFDVLPNELLESKFNDILTDCEILLYQVGQLEHILGRPSPISKVEKTFVYRDIIIKTINQLKPMFLERRFDLSKINYNPADSTRIKIYVDKAKLNQVVYNLLTNSIKYAEDDPETFAIKIEMEEDENNFIIKFKDWGIGISRELREKIFEDGFRTPEAIQMNVNGSGLGLTIARKIMRHMGGDLKLGSNHKPTEFLLQIPKKLSEEPNDIVRR